MVTFVGPMNQLSSNLDLDTLPPFPDLPARKQNIWLASYPKSGNTWMRLFLSAYMSASTQADINKDLADNHQCNPSAFAEAIAKKPVDQFSDIEIARVRTGIQRLYARSAQKLIIKTHGAVARFRGYETFDVDSTFASILVIRNPLAVLPSFAKHMGVSVDDAIIHMADRNTKVGDQRQGQLPVLISSWTDFHRSWIGRARALNAMPIKYEDMKQSPEQSFSRVLAHIRLPVEPQRVRQAIEATNFDTLKAQDLKTGFKERTRANKSEVFFRSGQIDSWRKELTEEQVVATIRNHWDVMEQLDYIPADYQDAFEDIKFEALEGMVTQGIDVGIYAQDLNALRKKRGIKTQLAVNSAKRAVGNREAKKKQKLKGRPAAKKTFG